MTTEFHAGDQVVLARGTYQGATGVFLKLKEDVHWADITERNGVVRSHPVEWLDHVTAPAATPLPTGHGSVSVII